MYGVAASVSGTSPPTRASVSWHPTRGGLATLEDMQQRKREREERLRILARLEQALASARQLYGFNK